MLLSYTDPNDVESPRTSFVLGGHLKMPQQSVGPNAEDLSLILGHGSIAVRGRSFSTSMNPKSLTESMASNAVSANAAASTIASGGGVSNGPGNSAGTAFDGQTEASQTPGSRKKSVPQSQKEKSTATAEDFFIDVILQRHARRLLQERRFIDLGYMSAALDFHLVGWLSREKERAARLEDYVVVLKQLHDDLQWPKPDLDLRVSSLVSEGTTTTQQDSPSYSLQSLRLDNNLETGDSGYTSLPPLMDTRLNFDPQLSQLALKSMNLANETEQAMHLSEHQQHTSEGSEMMSSYVAEEEMDDEEMYRQHQPIETSSWDSASMSGCGEGVASTKNKKRTIPQRLEVKVRYLLQIFTEANCLEVSLLLSVLLMDSGSISRITNAATRNGSLQLCRQLRNGLKDMTRWSFQECLGYRAFFINLQPQIYQLDNYVLQKEAIPFPTPVALSQVHAIGQHSNTGHRGSLPNNSVSVRGSLDGEGELLKVLLFQAQFKGRVPVGQFKRSDSVRSAGHNQMRQGTVGVGPSGPAMGMRKSKTELSINVTKKKNEPNRVTGDGGAGGAMMANVAIDTQSSSGDLIKGNGSEQSNCALM